MDACTSDTNVARGAGQVYTSLVTEHRRLIQRMNAKPGKQRGFQWSYWITAAIRHLQRGIHAKANTAVDKLTNTRSRLRSEYIRGISSTSAWISGGPIQEFSCPLPSTPPPSLTAALIPMHMDLGMTASFSPSSISRSALNPHPKCGVSVRRKTKTLHGRSVEERLLTERGLADRSF